jgi:hypothetical protein
VAAGAPAHAAITQFAQLSNANLKWVQSTGQINQVNSTNKSYDAVTFQYDTTALAGFGSLDAGLVFNGTTSSNVQTANVFGQTIVAQPLVTGSFTITYEGVNKTLGALTIHAGDVLLSGTYTGGDITGVNGHTGAALTADSTQTAPTYGVVTYSSPIESFGAEVNSIMSLTASATTSPIGYTAGGKLKNNSGLFSGNFSVDPGPTAAIPEPASWALMLVGFGGVGAFARRRKSVLAA